MGGKLDKEAKKEILKDIIIQLHHGLTVDEAKDRFEKEIREISPTEIAELEQSLINEGLSPNEIKKFCNVHALLFKSALGKATSEETIPSHPVSLFKLENREIEKLVNSLKNIIDEKEKYKFTELKEKLKETLLKLKGINIHYERKELLLFSFLEKQGFLGPSKVMWGKDNEIRDLFKQALAQIERVRQPADLENYEREALNPLIEEVLGMIFKEEHILFPTSIEKLNASDWVDILRESDQTGYAYIEKPEDTDVIVKELKSVLLEEPVLQDSAVVFPSGTMQISELMYLLNTLPVDITFVDRDDKVRYFSENAHRIFFRPRGVIGREVQNCHPPQSVDVVEKILKSFKEGTKDTYDFWIHFRDRLAYIKYLAVRDKDKRYLGTLEITQDITDIKNLEGEKRLIDERD